MTSTQVTAIVLTQSVTNVQDGLKYKLVTTGKPESERIFCETGFHAKKYLYSLESLKV